MTSMCPVFFFLIEDFSGGNSIQTFHSYFLSAYSALGTVQDPEAKVLYKVREIRSNLRRTTKRFSNDSWAADQNVASSVRARIWSTIKGKSPGRNKTKRLSDLSKHLE